MILTSALIKVTFTLECSCVVMLLNEIFIREENYIFVANLVSFKFRNLAVNKSFSHNEQERTKIIPL